MTNDTFDALNRQTVETLAAGTANAATTTTVFDALGSQTSLTNALGQVSSMVYDGCGRSIPAVSRGKRSFSDAEVE